MRRSAILLMLLPAAAAAACAPVAGSGSVASLAGPTGQAAPEGGATPEALQDAAQDAAGRERLFDETLVAAVYDKAVAALAEAAQIRMPERVPAVLLTAEEALARRKAFAATLDDDVGMTRALDLVADFVFSDSMLGRYLPDEKVLYIIEDVLERLAAQRARGGDLQAAAEELLFGVMAHELVHAYDDQVYAIMPQMSELAALAAAGDKIPELQSKMALIEGRATYAAELACLHADVPTLGTFTLEDVRDTDVFEHRAGDDTAESLGKGFVNVVARAKLVQYAYGREFAQAAYRFGGEKFFRQVFDHLPLTMAELEDFQRFKLRWAQEMEEALDAEDEPAEVD